MKKRPSCPLDMTASKISQRTVWRHYVKWRERRGVLVRCDNEHCRFFTAPLEWNGLPFKLILDHRSGNKFDNRPENLRFLCPNCDAQNVETRGGANARRIKRFLDGSYTAKRHGGIADAYLRVSSIGNVTKFGSPNALGQC